MGAKKRRPSPLVDALRRERVQRQMSQEELSEIAGFARSTIGRYETSALMPSLPSLEDWATALGLTIIIGERT